MESKSNNSGGTNFMGAIFIVFLVLKLTGFIDWSWWWVTAPLWGGVAIVLAIYLLGMAYVAVFVKIRVGKAKTEGNKLRSESTKTRFETWLEKSKAQQSNLN